MTTQKEKIRVYEAVLHRINMYAQITMDHEKLRKLIEKICNWSYAHRFGNGQYSDKEQDRIIEAAFKKLDKIED